MAVLTAVQLTGRDESHLVTLPCGHRLQEAAAEAFTALQTDARAAGFDLVISSSFRSFDRQLAIWNAKARGDRTVHDERGWLVAMAALSAREQLHAILRYSAMPGSSRHHWGTDLDVYNAAAVPEGYQVQLSPEEVAAGGLFDSLHRWLDARMAAGESRGFFRPYALDRGGVAPERWHLSFAPDSVGCAGQLTADLLRACWDGLEGESLLLRDEIEADLAALMERYVAVPADWCPR